MAALIVYENTWAIPFVAAARESGGELVASARIPATDVIAALEQLEAAPPILPRSPTRRLFTPYDADPSLVHAVRRRPVVNERRVAALSGASTRRRVDVAGRRRATGRRG